MTRACYSTAALQRVFCHLLLTIIKHTTSTDGHCDGTVTVTDTILVKCQVLLYNWLRLLEYLAVLAPAVHAEI